MITALGLTIALGCGFIGGLLTAVAGGLIDPRSEHKGDGAKHLFIVGSALGIAGIGFAFLAGMHNQ